MKYIFFRLNYLMFLSYKIFYLNEIFCENFKYKINNSNFVEMVMKILEYIFCRLFFIIFGSF